MNIKKKFRSLIVLGHLNKKAGQTPIESGVEIILGAVINYLLDICCYVILFPLLGYFISLEVALTAGAVVLVVRTIKNFFYRRLWNWILIKQTKELKRRSKKNEQKKA